MNGRNEWKYVINKKQKETLSNRLSAIMEKDEHTDSSNLYQIHSLYFDDDNFTCAQDTEAGINKRYKWRIRYYNDYSGNLNLEKKIKINNTCYKRVCTITENEYQALIRGEVIELLYSDRTLLKEFAYDIICRGFKPAILIDYEREAYIEPVTNIRITIDGLVNASDEVEGFLEKRVYGISLQENGERILEIKFDDVLPSYIKRACILNDIKQISFSKYNTGFEKVYGGR